MPHGEPPPTHLMPTRHTTGGFVSMFKHRGDGKHLKGLQQPCQNLQAVVEGEYLLITRDEGKQLNATI